MTVGAKFYLCSPTVTESIPTTVWAELRHRFQVLKGTAPLNPYSGWPKLLRPSMQGQHHTLQLQRDLIRQETPLLLFSGAPLASTPVGLTQETQTHVATAQDRDHCASGAWPPNWPACVFHCWRRSSTQGEEKGGNSAGGALFWNGSHLHDCPVLVSQSVSATTHQHPPYIKEQLCFQSITSLVSLLH